MLAHTAASLLALSRELQALQLEGTAAEAFEQALPP